jgi:DNA invertase Pin-like site-specific DNA recombinase
VTVPLQYLLSYEDRKIEKAYHRYLEGQSQKKIAKALKIPERTLARRCKEGEWEAERKIRQAAGDEPEVVAAVAADQSRATATEAAPLPEAPPKPGPDADATEPEQRSIDSMLLRQQRFTDRLFDCVDRASEELLRDLSGKPARVALAQASQLSTLGGRLLEMQRKAYRVPDKIETKDTTPTVEGRVRKLKDDELDRELAAVERAEAAAAAREAPAQSVN